MHRVITWGRRKRPQTILVTRQLLIVTNMETRRGHQPLQRIILALRRLPTETDMATILAHRQQLLITLVIQQPLIVIVMVIQQGLTGQVLTTLATLILLTLTHTETQQVLLQLPLIILVTQLLPTKTRMGIHKERLQRQQTILGIETQSNGVTIVIRPSGRGKPISTELPRKPR